MKEKVNEEFFLGIYILIFINFPSMLKTKTKNQNTKAIPRCKTQPRPVKKSPAADKRLLHWQKSEFQYQN